MIWCHLKMYCLFICFEWNTARLPQIVFIATPSCYVLHVSSSFLLQQQIVQYLKDMFDHDKVRFSSALSLAEDILSLSHRRSEILLGYLGIDSLVELNGALPRGTDSSWGPNFVTVDSCSTLILHQEDIESAFMAHSSGFKHSWGFIFTRSVVSLVLQLLRYTCWIIWVKPFLVISCCVWYIWLLSLFRLRCVLYLPCWVTWVLYKTHDRRTPNTKTVTFCTVTPNGGCVFSKPVGALLLCSSGACHWLGSHNLETVMKIIWCCALCFKWNEGYLSHHS